MKLVDDWKKMYRWFSVQAMSLAAAVQGTWILLPADLRTALGTTAVASVSIGLLLFGIFGRVVAQPKTETPKSPP